jgi:hypothetical protein
MKIHCSSTQKQPSLVVSTQIPIPNARSLLCVSSVNRIVVMSLPRKVETRPVMDKFEATELSNIDSILGSSGEGKIQSKRGDENRFSSALTSSKFEARSSSIAIEVMR